MRKKTARELRVGRCNAPFVEACEVAIAADKEMEARLHRTFAIGDKVLCKGSGDRAGTLVKNDAGGVWVELDASGFMTTMKYTTIATGHIRWPPISLMHRARATRKDCHTEDSPLRADIKVFMEEKCITNPGMNDTVNLHLARNHVITAPCLIRVNTWEELHEKFLARYPQWKGSCSMWLFRRLNLWYVRKAKPESCLCRICTNYKGFMAGILDVAQVLIDAKAAEGDAEEQANDVFTEDDAELVAPKPQVSVSVWPPEMDEILTLAKCTSKSAQMAVMCCSDDPLTAKDDCVTGKCEKCGYTRWLGRLLSKLVDGDGQLRKGVPLCWLEEIAWYRYEMVPRELEETDAEEQTTTEEVAKDVPEDTAMEGSSTTSNGWVQSTEPIAGICSLCMRSGKKQWFTYCSNDEVTTYCPTCMNYMRKESPEERKEADAAIDAALLAKLAEPDATLPAELHGKKPAKGKGKKKAAQPRQRRHSDEALAPVKAVVPCSKCGAETHEEKCSFSKRGGIAPPGLDSVPVLKCSHAPGCDFFRFVHGVPPSLRELAEKCDRPATATERAHFGSIRADDYRVTAVRRHDACVALHEKKKKASLPAKKQKKDDDDDDDFGVSAAPLKTRLDRVRVTGTVIDFLQALEQVFQPMCQHRRTIARCKRAALWFKRHAIPGMLFDDIDWAENYVIAVAQMIQSQYWAQVSCSLFVSVLRWLNSAAWNNTNVLSKGQRVVRSDGSIFSVKEQRGDVVEMEGQLNAEIMHSNRSDVWTVLKPKDEVTTSGSCERPATWAEVISQEGAVVTVQFDDETTAQIPRSQLHHRACLFFPHPSSVHKPNK